MKRLALVLTAAVFTLGLTATAQEQRDRITVPLTDPARPVTLEITLYAGAVTVSTYEGREILIEASGAGSRFSKSAKAVKKQVLEPAAKKQTSPLPVPNVSKGARFL